MKITQNTVKIKELVKAFEDRDDEGVVGYGGKLDIRPPYQREFRYNDKEQIEVINSIFKNFPLNVMYWVKNATTGNYELLDGQQRTLSICYYQHGDFSVLVDDSLKYYVNLTDEQRDRFLNYELQIYICEDATEKERLDWFRIINIAGKKLTPQELRNAVYPGPWITNAKKFFSKKECLAFKLGEKYMNGNPREQKYLETVLKWIKSEDESIENYMASHQYDPDANLEWQYFCDVIEWVKRLFPKWRDIMKNVEWGELYNRYKDVEFSPDNLENEVKELFESEELENKKGIYEYVISRDERVLNFRSFPESMKWEAYERQNGICMHCGEHFDFSQMEGDHIKPWSEGGKTTADNCQMLCRECNRRKSNK